MECEENGDGVVSVAGQCGVKRKRRVGGSGEVQVALAPALSGANSRRALQSSMRNHQIPATPLSPHEPSQFASPFINVSLMEEITFWVCTRRAPCLYRYNNVFKKNIEEAHCSKFKHSRDPSYADEVPSPKKKKTNIRLLDDEESVSSERQQNVYFDNSHKQYRRSWYSSSKSYSDRSDVDFNINSSIRNKSKTKVKRKNCTKLHKKSKLVTSTPKPTTLRRSLRKSQQNLYSNRLNCSFGILNSSAVNGDHIPSQEENDNDKNKNIHHISSSKRDTKLKEQSKNEIVPNGQFEDISDVSGFTANYIRSTKINSKAPRKVTNKPNRKLVRESHQKLQKVQDKIILCVNKSANAGLPATELNQSTDSSQNINLVTVNNNNNEKSQRINQNPSQLKLSDLENDQNKEREIPINVSFHSKSSRASRYPTRHKYNSKAMTQDLENRNALSIKKKMSRGARELKSINLNENVNISLVSRTRSGKQIGVAQISLQESGCSQVQGQINNLMEVSSCIKKTVAASPVSKRVGKRKRVASTKKTADKETEPAKDSCDSVKKESAGVASSSYAVKCVGRKVADKTRQSLKRDSLRDKSGYAACFSDSEEDKPLIRRKFFCYSKS